MVHVCFVCAGQSMLCEQRWLNIVKAKGSQMSPDAFWALARAIKTAGLETARVAVDDLDEVADLRGIVVADLLQRLHISLRFGLHDTPIEERLHPREALEIRVARCVARDVETRAMV